LNWEATSVIGVKPAEGNNGDNDKIRWGDGCRWRDRWKEWYCCEPLGFGGADVLTLLGEMSHDGLVGVGTVPSSIGIYETVESFTISCLDGIEPCLLDREA
jgi:hypothetical protein